jgi:subtilisin
MAEMKKSAVLISILIVLALVLSGSSTLAAPPDRIKVIIGFDRTPGPAEQALVRGCGGEIKSTFTIVPGIAATIPETAMAGLARNPQVTAIVPDGKIQALEDYPWGVQRIGANIVQASGNNGGGVKVAVIDTGIDMYNEEFIGIFKGGYDFVDDDYWPLDMNGHGTHVSGIIAADAGRGEIIGVAPGVELYALRVLDASGSGYFSDIVDAVQWASGGVVDRNGQLIQGVRCDITNNSYGSDQNPDLPFFPWVEGAFTAAYDLDNVLHVAAAGNLYAGPDTVAYPAKYDAVIAVAATDINNNRADFSSTGPDVELAAPGAGIYSCVLNNLYESWSGTSMASPHAAGAAALVLAANPTFSNVQIRTQLQETATDMGAPGRDELYGYGLVDADKAAGAVINPKAGVTEITTGYYSGKGRTKTFITADTFSAGSAVVIRATVKDESGNPVAIAAVSLSITGPVTIDLNAGPSNNQGMAEATWKTSAPGRKSAGTAKGQYTISITGVSANGYTWDQAAASKNITIN